MTRITKIRGTDAVIVANNLDKALSHEGYSADVRVKDHSVNVGQVRLAKGHNLQVSQVTKSGFRKTNALSWDDWVKVNNTMNKVLNDLHGEANINSLGGKFKIREGKHVFTENDWENLKYENVGSQMYPITRYDYIKKMEAEESGHKKRKLGEMV